MSSVVTWQVERTDFSSPLVIGFSPSLSVPTALTSCRRLWKDPDGCGLSKRTDRSLGWSTYVAHDSQLPSTLSAHARRIR
jgi:hypothetical protein